MNLEPLRELEEVRALLSKATPGPWRWSENGNLMAPGDRDVDEICAVYTERDDDAEPANAAAIRAAVNFIRTHGEALSRALAQLDDGWRPIAEAPKDGTYVVLYDSRYKHGPSSYLIAQYDHNAWWGQRTLRGHSIVWNDATHFRPLPYPPAQEDAT